MNSIFVLHYVLPVFALINFPSICCFCFFHSNTR